MKNDNTESNQAMPTFGKIKKPNRKKTEPPRFLINDRKKGSYDLYAIRKKPQD